MNPDRVTIAQLLPARRFVCLCLLCHCLRESLDSCLLFFVCPLLLLSFFFVVFFSVTCSITEKLKDVLWLKSFKTKLSTASLQSVTSEV